MSRLTRANFGALPVSPTDGAWGTELMKLGWASTELKDLWNVSAPDKVLQVARSYVEAGARIILPNTFSANAVVIARHGAAGRSAEVTRAGAAISRQAAGDLPVGVSFSFDSGKEKDCTMMGVTPAQAWQLAREGGASFVGANCGIGIDAYVKVALQFAACGGELPLWIKGNAGRPEMEADGSVHYRAGPEDFSRAVPPLVEAGVRFIGCCCGSTPDHVRAIVAAVDKLRAEGRIA
jgi:methionine synthase I (cobalamin-dependent)